MNGIYPDDYEKSIDYDSFKKAIEHLAPMCLISTKFVISVMR